MFWHFFIISIYFLDLATSKRCICDLNKTSPVFIFQSICEHPKAHGGALSSKMIDLVYSQSLSVASCKKSQLLDRIHHVVCCPGSGFSVGPLSILIFQASGLPAVVEGWSMFSHPIALFCGWEASCFSPSHWRLGIVHRSQSCTHRWHFKLYKSCHLNVSLCYMQHKHSGHVRSTMGGINEEEQGEQWAQYRTKVFMR